MAPRSANAASTGAILALTAAGAASVSALLAEVAASETGQVAMTQDQATEALGAGLIEVVGAADANGLAPVKLTDAGFAKFNENETAGKNVTADNTPVNSTASRPAVAFKLSSAVPPPSDEGVRRGRSNGYPFATMEVNESFHVAPTAEYPDPAERLASSVSGARNRFAEETGETETVNVKTYKKGDDGKFLKDAEGKRIVDTEKPETRPIMKVTRDFIVRAVDATDPDGIGARVWRIA